MKYRIIVQQNALSDMYSIVLGISGVSNEAAAKWYERCQMSIETLTEFPDRCPKIPEPHLFDVTIRHLLFGASHRRYRIVFAISEQNVFILRVRHWAEAPMHPEELMSDDL